MKKCGCWLLMAGMYLATPLAQAGMEVRVEGLFKGAAVLRINGEQVMLRDGMTAPSGVKLIAATSKNALLEIEGKRQTLELHMAIGGQYSEPESRQVAIRKSKLDQYLVNGSINGQSVQFMVDTGANTVAMNESQARRLGLQYQVEANAAQVVTAGGISKSWKIRLDRVKVGEIQVANVDAVVVQGDFPTQILLGMSYLNHVKMQEHNSVLQLEQKY